MDRIFEAIEEWMRNLLTGMVSSNLTTMYTDVNKGYNLNKRNSKIKGNKTNTVKSGRTVYMGGVT